MGFKDKFKSRQHSSIVDIEDATFIDGTQRFPFMNCLIAGTKSSGRDALLRILIADALNSNQAVFVIQNGSAMPKNSIFDFFKLGWGNRKVFEIDLASQAYSAAINFFKGSSIDFVQELIVLLMSTYRSMTPELQSFSERFLSEVLSLYRIDPQIKFSLKSIMSFDDAWIVKEATRLNAVGLISDAKRDTSIAYANDLSLYKREWNEFVNFCIEIQKQNFATLLSGNISYAEINTQNYINFIKADYISCAKQSNGLISLLIHKAIQTMRSAHVRTTFVFEDIDVATVKEFKDLLRACQAVGNNVYFTMDSITNVAALGYDPRDFCNAYFVFRQPVFAAAEEWAKTCGTHKEEKVTHTTSPYDQVYGPRNEGFLGGLANLINRRKQVVTGETRELVDEYNILPKIFMELPYNASEVIIKSSFGETYYKQVSWT